MSETRDIETISSRFSWSFLRSMLELLFVQGQNTFLMLWPRLVPYYF